jgi:glycosyltransferase involved in cell wall biosynthesis
MRPDVSVIMPAYRAAATIGRAVRSVFAQKGVAVELVLCADDDLDYAALPADLRSGDRLTVCRTPAPRSGPSVARNIATRQARADIIACLDADDAYGTPDRLALLLPLVEQYGVATGPTGEIDPRTRATRTARPRLGGAFLPIEDICELRMPFSPVYRKAKCPAGWPQIDFAEDVILNVDLICACGAYPFVEGAEYLYHLSDGSRSHSAHALQRARTGYLQILDLVDKRDWPPAVREVVRRVFNEDLAAVERAQASRASEASTWRAIVRDGSAS